MKNKLIIVAGGSGSGKTTIAKTILESVKPGQAQIVCLDRFYLAKREDIPTIGYEGHKNYDHPDSFDWPLLIKCIKDLVNNKTAMLPVYDYVVQHRDPKMIKTKPTKLIIIEGTLPLYNYEFAKLADLKVFVDTPLDECLIRRIQRDTVERGRSLKSIIKQWKEAVKPMYVQYLEPTKKYADIILPWEKTNVTGIEVLTNAIKTVCK